MQYQRTSFNPSFSQNSTLIRLIYINLAVYLGVKLLYLLFWLMASSISPDQWALNWLAVPANLGSLVFKPWTVFSYMFFHLDFWHIFGNMLWLYFLGQIFSEFLGDRKLWTVYVAGGLAGALLYILFYNVFPVFEQAVPMSKALGASASVMAVIVGVGTYVPNFSIRLLLLGNVKLKYIALFWFVFDLLSISNSNSGGHIAHLGGAALGFFFAREWRKGRDITAFVYSSWLFISSIFKGSGKSKMKVSYKRSSKSQTSTVSDLDQKKVDAILDKISKSGYDSLTKAEKDFLFKASQNK